MNLSDTNLNNTAVYIHIPFCDHKCIYCDFYSLVNYDNLEPYLSALNEEIQYYAERFSENRVIDTIFFGGGTPSFVEPGYISEIIESVRKYFTLSPNAEITLETNPGTVSISKLKEYLNSGINRLSIGIQSFNDAELKFLTRIHDEKTAIKTVENAYRAGFDNISIDLIFSLPGQSEKTWEDNLKKAVTLPVQHISAYSLILERGTILNKMVLDGKIKMTSENHDADLYKFTMDYLTDKGFSQYEVSNFAKTGYECIHNLFYWSSREYFGFGTSSHSFTDGERWWNYSSLKMYIEEIKKKNNAVRGREILSHKQMLNEYIMLALRSKGLEKEKLETSLKDWYFEKKKNIDSFIKESYLEENENRIKCTPKGYMVCDELINKLL